MINLTFSREKTERKHLIYIYVPLRQPKLMMNAIVSKEKGDLHWAFESSYNKGETSENPPELSHFLKYFL